MKYLLVIFALVFLTTCKKTNDHEPPLPEGHWGDATAEKNNNLWTAHPGCWIDIVNKKNINIDLDSFAFGNYLTESLGIFGIPPTPGTYKVFKLEPFTTKLYASLDFWDADVPLGHYDIVESETNEVTLESIDTLSKEIRGTFNFTFKVDKRPYSNTPDTIRFKNGVFHGKIEKL